MYEEVLKLCNITLIPVFLVNMDFYFESIMSKQLDCELLRVPGVCVYSNNHQYISGFSTSSNLYSSLAFKVETWNFRG